MFVAFEGVNGGGKTTLLGEVHRELSERHVACTIVEEFPSSFLEDAIGDLRRREPYLRLHPTQETATAQTLLMASLFAFKVEALILPLLAAGSVVLVDRYLDSLHAYQTEILVGTGSMSEQAASQWIFDCTRTLPRSNLTVFVRPSLDTVCSRRAGRGEKVTEAELAFLRSLLQRYDQQLAGTERNVMVVENALSPQQSAATITVAIQELIAR